MDELEMGEKGRTTKFYIGDPAEGGMLMNLIMVALCCTTVFAKFDLEKLSSHKLETCTVYEIMPSKGGGMGCE